MQYKVVVVAGGREEVLQPPTEDADKAHSVYMAAKRKHGSNKRKSVRLYRGSTLLRHTGAAIDGETKFPPRPKPVPA